MAADGMVDAARFGSKIVRVNVPAGLDGLRGGADDLAVFAYRNTARDPRDRNFVAARKNPVSSSLSEPNAITALSTIGKKHTRNTMITFGRTPKPGYDMNSGANAIFGVISMETQKG